MARSYMLMFLGLIHPHSSEQGQLYCAAQARYMAADKGEGQFLVFCMWQGEGIFPLPHHYMTNKGGTHTSANRVSSILLLRWCKVCFLGCCRW